MEIMCNILVALFNKFFCQPHDLFENNPHQIELAKLWLEHSHVMNNPINRQSSQTCPNPFVEFHHHTLFVFAPHNKNHSLAYQNLVHFWKKTGKIPNFQIIGPKKYDQNLSKYS